MKIQILGSGCPSCQTLEANVRTAVSQIKEENNQGQSTEFVIEKITDTNAIVEMGVMMTPAMAINGTVKSSGKLLTPQESQSIIQTALADNS